MRRDKPLVALTPRRRRRRRLYPFRMVILNGVGWSVLLGTAGVVGAVLGMLTGRVVVGMLAGVLVLGAAVGVDRLRWRESWMGIHVESEELAHQIVGLLEAQGREARVDTYRWDDDSGSHVNYSVEVRQRDADVAAELAGCPPPRRW